MSLYNLTQRKPDTGMLWGSDGGSDGFDWRLLIGGGLVVVGGALTMMGATRKDPVSALAGTALAGGGGYLMYQGVKGGEGGGGELPSGVPTVAGIMAAKTEADLEDLRTIIEAASNDGKITYEQYTTLLTAFRRQWNYLTLYSLVGDQWIEIADEYLSRTEGVTDVDKLNAIYEELYAKGHGEEGGQEPPPGAPVPTVTEIMATKTKGQLESLRRIFDSAYSSGSITQDLHHQLQTAYIRQNYYLDLYLQGGKWIEAANEYLAQTEGVTDQNMLYNIYHKILEEGPSPTVAEIMATRTKDELEELLTKVKEAFSDGRITEEQYDTLFTACIRQSFYLGLYLRGWIEAADEYLFRTQGVTDTNQLAAIYHDVYDKYAPLIQTQLGDCWPYIAGGGYQEGDYAIWVYRNGGWLVFDSRGNIDQIGEFKSGDSVSLYAVQSCYLASAGRQLTTGWNDFTW